MERSTEPEQAAIVSKPGLFERIIGWLVEQIAKAIWRTLIKPVLVAAFSPLILGRQIFKARDDERHGR